MKCKDLADMLDSCSAILRTMSDLEIETALTLIEATFDEAIENSEPITLPDR